MLTADNGVRWLRWQSAESADSERGAEWGSPGGAMGFS